MRVPDSDVDDARVPRRITRVVVNEFFEWTFTAPMFLSSPEGRAFAVEMREVFNLACEALEKRGVG